LRDVFVTVLKSSSEMVLVSESRSETVSVTEEVVCGTLVGCLVAGVSSISIVSVGVEKRVVNVVSSVEVGDAVTVPDVKVSVDIKLVVTLISTTSSLSSGIVVASSSSSTPCFELFDFELFSLEFESTETDS